MVLLMFLITGLLCITKCTIIFIMRGYYNYGNPSFAPEEGASATTLL